MRKKEAVGIITALLLGMTAGCAPGDISRYTAQAQQAGKAIFEGEPAPVSAEGREAEPDLEAEAETKAVSSADDAGTEAKSPEENDGAEETESLEGNTGAEETESPEGPAGAAKPESETEKPADEAEAAELPAMMTEADERIQEAFSGKAEFFSGKLSGKDGYNAAELEALQAVLRQEEYDDKTLCLINSAQFEEQETGSFLLFCDSTALTAKGRISGDLWFCAGQEAVELVDGADFMQMRSIQCAGKNYLLTQIEMDEDMIAQVYRVEAGKAAACFREAVSIEQEEGELRVNYKADYTRYDPVSGWDDSDAEITYFYAPGEDGFEQIKIRELTAEQYLAYIQPDENNAEALRFKEEQEEKFYHDLEETQECRYSFFAIGEDRIGYRECRIALPDENMDKTGREAAEYRYHIVKLDNGKLTLQCETLSGSGYYFREWEKKDEEFQQLSEIPPMYLKNRIDRAAQTLRAKELTALQCVQKVQEYGADDLCFVQQADYDGDGETETFVAVGRYKGEFGAPVCDLWYVSGEDAVLLAENLPVKSAFNFESGGVSLFLLKGYAVDGISDRLYGVEEGSAKRYLENAAEVEIEENGDLTARIAKQDGELPYYYYVQDGNVTEYGAEQVKPEKLLDYENGRALYKRLQKLAALQNAELSCLKRENGLLHVMFTDHDGRMSYETYCVREGSLVLIDCGDGGYEAAVPKTAEGEPEEIEKTEGTEEAVNPAEG